MPPLVATWVKASREIGANFDLSQQPPEGVSRGYAMPEAALLANLANEKTRQGFFAMFIKLSDLLAYRVGFMGPAHAGLSNDEWQRILGLEVLGSTEGTKADAARQQLIKRLQDLTSTSKRLAGKPVCLPEHIHVYYVLTALLVDRFNEIERACP